MVIVHSVLDKYVKHEKGSKLFKITLNHICLHIFYENYGLRVHVLKVDTGIQYYLLSNITCLKCTKSTNIKFWLSVFPQLFADKHECALKLDIISLHQFTELQLHNIL